MKLFDSHCHFDFDVFQEDFAHQVDLAREQGVERILIPSVGPSNWTHIQALANQYSHLYYALGFHPYFLQPEFEQFVPELESLLSSSSRQCVAICLLYTSPSPRDRTRSRMPSSA